MITKYLIPLVAIIGFGGGSFFGVKLLAPKCPDCNPTCPEQKPCQGIDFDKIKSRNITIQNEQYITVSGDSLLVKKIEDALGRKLEDFKVRKCK